MALFTALDHYRRDLQRPQDIPGILDVALRYVAELNLFHTQAFYLVDPADLSFQLALCDPAPARPRLERLIHGEIRAGKFAWALRQNAPVSFESRTSGVVERGVFHSLGVATHIVGMFCGLLRGAPVPAQEITDHLLSLLLGISADALGAARKTAALTSQIQTLSGLLPICSWCKKIRDDQGYWKQLENYIESRSGATFSHGVCPECAKRMLAEARG
jgi:hypothetical protein